jgi:hypothetical protein
VGCFSIRHQRQYGEKLLFLPGPLPQLEDLLKSFDRLKLEDGQPKEVPKVKLIGPVDHAQITRYPKGDLEREAIDQLAVAYVVESQFGQPGRELWSPSWIQVVSPTHSAPLRGMKIPFGVGQQPHRWRVWAISRNGVVPTSDWRTVDFTDQRYLCHLLGQALQRPGGRAGSLVTTIGRPHLVDLRWDSLRWRRARAPEHRRHDCQGLRWATHGNRTGTAIGDSRSNTSARPSRQARTGTGEPPQRQRTGSGQSSAQQQRQRTWFGGKPRKVDK